MIDDIRMPLTEWTRRHNLWADAEVRELLEGHTEGRLSGRLFGSSIEQKRLLRGMYNGLPLFFSSVSLIFLQIYHSFRLPGWA